MLFILSLLAADPAAMMKIAAAQASIACGDMTCGAGPSRSPYRLDPNIAGPADGKAAALAEDGQQCAITGPTVCTDKPPTLYTASY